MEFHNHGLIRGIQRYHRRMHGPASFNLLRFGGWYWRLPALALICLIAGVVAFVVLTLDQDRQELRATLRSDVLWLEQNLRFQLERNEEQLSKLAADLLDGKSASPVDLARARQLLSSDTGFTRIYWLDGESAMLGSLPPVPEEKGSTLTSVTAAVKRALAYALPSYGPVGIAGGESVLAVAVPHYEGVELKGFVVGVYSLRRVLSTQVPWWFSEKYRLVVQDDAGREIAAKSRVATLSEDLSYVLPLESMGNGLTLRVSAYRAGTRLVPLAFAGAVIIFAAATLGSLWMLWRHARRRQLAEQALQREFLFRRAMEDSLHTGLRARDLAGHITYVNPAFCRMVGWSAEELVGTGPPMPYWLPEEIDHTREVHDKILAGEASHQGLELRFRRKNGETFDALIYEAPLIDANGTHTGWMASVVDVTDLKRAEELARTQQERLQATAKLVAMGEMASTLAHELNQPLAAITSYSSGCLNALQADAVRKDELLPILDKIARQAQRAGNIIRRIHEFVRRSEPSREPTDIVRVVREAAALLEGTARKRAVRVALSFAHDVPSIEGDTTMLEQVVVNIMRNGMDAMANAARADRQLRVSVSAHEEYVEVAVADRGVGISPEVGEKLYSPFFTTKEEGMGMGLNICRSIIELHRGRLWHETNPVGGTIFRFTLPRTPADVKSAEHDELHEDSVNKA